MVEQRIIEQEFTVYSQGLAMASVCTTLANDQATERMNAINPTGIPSPWTIADEPFRTGEPNGTPCEQAPETHRHLLFEC